MENLEIEVKFYVTNLAALSERLVSSPAVLSQPRTFEVNLRFDNSERSLSNALQVLRLRQDREARLTFKGPAKSEDGVRIRQEIEFVVSDFSKAHDFLLALGYQAIMRYEKYRTIYDLEGVHVTLDELPYGNFVELEGADVASIRAVNAWLGLDWEANVSESYTMLFEQLRLAKRLPFSDLTFKNFDSLTIRPEDLKVRAADI